MERKPLPVHPDELRTLLEHATRCRDQFETIIKHFPASEPIKKLFKEKLLAKVAESLAAIAEYLDGRREIGAPLNRRQMIELSDTVQRLKREIRVNLGDDRPQLADADRPRLVDMPTADLDFPGLGTFAHWLDTVEKWNRSPHHEPIVGESPAARALRYYLEAPGRERLTIYCLRVYGKEPTAELVGKCCGEVAVLLGTNAATAWSLTVDAALDVLEGQLRPSDTLVNPPDDEAKRGSETPPNPSKSPVAPATNPTTPLPPASPVKPLAKTAHEDNTLPATLADQMRRHNPRAKLSARLMHYMENRDSATYLEIAREIYDNYETSGDAIEKLIGRTNDILLQLGSPDRFRYGAEHVFKEASPE